MKVSFHWLRYKLPRYIFTLFGLILIEKIFNIINRIRQKRYQQHLLDIIFELITKVVGTDLEGWPANKLEEHCGACYVSKSKKKKKIKH